MYAVDPANPCQFLFTQTDESGSGVVGSNYVADRSYCITIGSGHGATIRVSYESEYTTSHLQDTTVAALPAWGPLPAFGDAACAELASRELSADESSYSIMQSKYQFGHKISPTGSYKLSWVERFTPDGGGATIDTPRSYTWDGTIPTGYDESDSTTWPKATPYEIDEPGSNGTISIADLTYNCGAGDPIQVC